jgi:uncharacterized LabA/DUF88 family protein
MSAAWFVDGAYMFKCWQSLGRPDRLDYLRLRRLLEGNFLDTTKGEEIGDAYYFNSDNDPPSARQNAFHMALQYPPPNGPGLRVKLYWLQRQRLYWPQAWGGGPVIHPQNGQHYELVQQKSVDVSLATHLMRSFAKRAWTKLFFCAGDGDFHEPIQHLVEYENIHVVLVGVIQTVSTELLPYARGFVRLDEVAGQVARQ